MNTSDTARTSRRKPLSIPSGTTRLGAAPTARAARRAPLLAALGLALAAVGNAQAARYGVRVVDASGEPVAGAAVCIGIEGGYRRFGAVFTDAQGRVEPLDVPDVPLVVTVSKTRFSAMRFSQPARRYDLVREVVLESGVPGPRCKAGSSMVVNPPALDVLRVDVTESGGRTVLALDVNGEPSHYRIGREETLDSAPWQRFEPSITLPAALASTGTLRLQLRRFEGGSDAWLETLSDPVTVTPRRSVAQP